MKDRKMLFEYRRLDKRTNRYSDWENSIVKELKLDKVNTKERKNILKYYEIKNENYNKLNSRAGFKEYIIKMCEILITLITVVLSLYVFCGNSVENLMNSIYQENDIKKDEYIKTFKEVVSSFIDLYITKVLTLFMIVLGTTILIYVIYFVIKYCEVTKENYYKAVVEVIKNYDMEHMIMDLNVEENEENYNKIVLQAEKNIVKKPHDLLFKYRSLSIINDDDTGNTIDNLKRTADIIKNKRIYVPCLSQLNDPFEGKFISFNAYGKMGGSIEKAMGYKDYLLKDMYKKHVLSFSTSATEPLLWAHYATDYSGVCLIFKVGKIYENYKDITYYNEDTRPETCYIRDLKQAKKIGDINVYYKNSKWDYEKEVRLEYDESDLQESKYIEFNQDELIGVIIGEKISENAKQKIIEVCKSNRVILYKTYIDYCQDKIYIVHNDFNPVANGVTIREQYKLYCGTHSEILIDIEGNLIK